eukprot:SAG22_NODE_1599_length_4030_cov_39.665225_1_plen_370_part_00
MCSSARPPRGPSLTCSQLSSSRVQLWTPINSRRVRKNLYSRRTDARPRAAQRHGPTRCCGSSRARGAVAGGLHERRFFLSGCSGRRAGGRYAARRLHRGCCRRHWQRCRSQQFECCAGGAARAKRAVGGGAGGCVDSRGGVRPRRWRRRWAGSRFWWGCWWGHASGGTAPASQSGDDTSPPDGAGHPGTGGFLRPTQPGGSAADGRVSRGAALLAGRGCHAEAAGDRRAGSPGEFEAALNRQGAGKGGGAGEGARKDGGSGGADRRAAGGGGSGGCRQQQRDLAWGGEAGARVVVGPALRLDLELHRGLEGRGRADLGDDTRADGAPARRTRARGSTRGRHSGGRLGPAAGGGLWPGGRRGFGRDDRRW